MGLFVNDTPFMIRLREHFLVSTIHGQPVRQDMWLPTPMYERIPQFWFLLGLLFIATGLLLGFEFVLTFWYMAIGIASASFGAGIFLTRLRHRMDTRGVAEAPVPAEPAPEEPENAEPARADDAE